MRLALEEAPLQLDDVLEDLAALTCQQANEKGLQFSLQRLQKNSCEINNFNLFKFFKRFLQAKNL